MNKKTSLNKQTSELCEASLDLKIDNSLFFSFVCFCCFFLLLLKKMQMYRLDLIKPNFFLVCINYHLSKQKMKLLC